MDAVPFEQGFKIFQRAVGMADGIDGMRHPYQSLRASAPVQVPYLDH
jgi:hypothetical protein